MPTAYEVHMMVNDVFWRSNVGIFCLEVVCCPKCVSFGMQMMAAGFVFPGSMPSVFFEPSLS